MGLWWTGGRKGIQSLVGGLGEAQGDEEKSFQEQVHGNIHKTTDRLDLR